MNIKFESDFVFKTYCDFEVILIGELQREYMWTHRERERTHQNIEHPEVTRQHHRDNEGAESPVNAG